MSRNLPAYIAARYDEPFVQTLSRLDLSPETIEYKGFKLQVHPDGYYFHMRKYGCTLAEAQRKVDQVLTVKHEAV